MFHDSMAIAQEKMTDACSFLERHTLPPTPLNYQVAYNYISQSNTALNDAIDLAIESEENIDCVFIETLYFEFLHTGNTSEIAIVKNVDGVINSLSRNVQTTEKQVAGFCEQINDCINIIDKKNVEKSRQALSILNKKTAEQLKQHKRFREELTHTKQLNDQTQTQLTQLLKLHIIDSQTGLYKRHYLTQQAQLWSNQNKSICAIAIQIDNLTHFIDNYGDLIGDVILNKVARQIQKYVSQSGLPGRTTKDQFTVLLADIDPLTANVIAEKIRNSVKRLRFVSSKNGTKLPNIDISLGIARYQQDDDFNKLAKNASNAALNAKKLGLHCFTAEH